MYWTREQKIGCAAICSLGAVLGLFVGFVIFTASIRDGGTGRVFAFWIQHPDLYWPWPMFGSAIAGLAFWAVWTLRRPSIDKPRIDDYHSLISATISILPADDRANRETIYNRARAVLKSQILSSAEFDQEQLSLEIAIWRLEKAYRARTSNLRIDHNQTIRLSDPRHQTSTAGLLFSIWLLPAIWEIDVTCMSLYWVARLREELQLTTTLRSVGRRFVWLFLVWAIIARMFSLAPHQLPHHWR